MRSCSLIVALLLLSAPVVRAETPQDTQEARSLAVEGQREFSLGNYEVALDLLQRSYKKHPLPALLYNVAQCHRLLGHLEQARRVYKAFLDAAPESPVAPIAREKMVELEAALKAQASVAKAGPETLTRTEKAPSSGDQSDPLSPPPVASKSMSAPADVSPPLALAAPPPPPPGVVASTVPRSAMPAAAPEPQPAAQGSGSNWGWWVAGGAAAVAAGVVVAVLASSSSSKSVNEPTGSFSAR